MNYVKLIIITLLLSLIACQKSQPSTAGMKHMSGKLKVGFDIDDTILFSRDNFLNAPHLSDDPDHLDFAWVNLHDSLYSVIIEPIADLIGFLRFQGHEIYFITARPGMNGEALARFLSRELGFTIEKDRNLFFSPKAFDPETGHSYSTKHELIHKLGLHIFYGDADNDMVAASIAGIRGVRVVRDQRSVDAYSRNYFGDTRFPTTEGAPYTNEDYQKFMEKGVGPYGETIFPIYTVSPSERSSGTSQDR